MKTSKPAYPRLRDLTPSPVGEALYRGVKDMDMPFAHKMGLNGDVAYTRNGFPEVHAGQAEPYLYGTYMTLSTAVAGASDQNLATSYPERGVTQHLAFKEGPFTGDTFRFGYFGAQAPYIGDGYVLSLVGTLSGDNDPATLYWPAMVQAHTAGPLHFDFEALDATKNHSLMLVNQPVGNDGLTYAVHAFQLHAGGWLDDARRYSFAFTGYTTALGSDSTHKLRTPFAFWGNTAARKMYQVPYPYYPDRYHQPSFSYRVGKGRYRRLHLMSNSTDWDHARGVPALPPYIAKSDDHGQTWGAIAATFLEEFLLHLPNDTNSGWSTLWDDDHTFNVGMYSSFHHVGTSGGQDVAFFYVSNAKVSTGPNWDDFGFRPRLWKMVGDSFTEVLSFPARTWRVDKLGSPIRQVLGDPTSIDGYLYVFDNEIANQILSFGNGCWMCTAYTDGAWRMLSTTDFGSTWQLSGPLPATVLSPWSQAAYPVVLSPRVVHADDSVTPAKIMFVGADYGRNCITFYVTDESFTGFKLLGRVKPKHSEGALGVGGGLRFGSSSINVDFMWSYIGNKTDKQPLVNPAYPGVFDEPRSP